MWKMRIGKMIIRERMTAGAILWETMMISLLRIMMRISWVSRRA